MTSTPVLIGVGYDGGSSYQRGPAEAPAVIRQALWSDIGNAWSESLRDIGAPGVLDDAGDLDISPADVVGSIDAGITARLGPDKVPLVLGGDHSITFPVVRALHRARGDFTLLHFDAHPDLYDDFEGNRFSHACPFARIMEASLATRLVQVGIRTSSGIQAEQARRFKVEQVSPAAWEAGWRPMLSGPVYLSIDLDVLDPAFAPGVSHHEPGGCSTRQLLTTLAHIEVPIVGVDIVELNPRNDPLGITARVSAKLVKELAARIRFGGPGAA
jgi:agmatinase